MLKCCIKGCESAENNETTDCAYFSFPLHNRKLLEKWLWQVRSLDLNLYQDQICSLHFEESDIDRHPDGVRLYLKTDAVPKIFPLRKAEIFGQTSYKNCSRTLEALALESTFDTFNIDINGNHNSCKIEKLSNIDAPLTTNDQKLQPCCNELEIGAENFKFLKDVFSTSQTELRNILPKLDTLNSTQSDLSPKVNLTSERNSDIRKVSRENSNSPESSICPCCPNEKKKPTLKISIQKYYNIPENLNEKKITGLNEGDFEKQIKITNAVANKMVIFKLDRKNGEIILETKALQSSTEKKNLISRRKKRKVHTLNRPRKQRGLYQRDQRDCNCLKKRLERQIDEKIV